jgi:hypothetical protein
MRIDTTMQPVLVRFFGGKPYGLMMVGDCGKI